MIYKNNLKKSFLKINSIRTLLIFLFTFYYYLDVKLLHYLTNFKIPYILYILFIVSCLVPTNPENEPMTWQVYGLFFILYTIVVACTNFLFAKIKPTRKHIDNILGPDFVSYHKVNMWPRQAAKTLAAVGTGYALVQGDAAVAKQMNAHALDLECQTSIANSLPQPTPQRVKEIMDKPSVLQKTIDSVVQASVDVAKQEASSTITAKHTKKP